MAHIIFPDPRTMTTSQGIVAVGGNLQPTTLIAAYRAGIFPWFSEGMPIAWFCPGERAILRFRNLHIPRSLARERRRTTFRLTFNQAFPTVITTCARIRRAGESGTWITRGMIKAYCRLHELGHAHSIEVWDKDELVGGLYGVEVAGTFAGESMFHTRANASKFALLHLIEHLRNAGLEWIDVQMMTPHLEALGAELVGRDEFLDLLAQTQREDLKLFGVVN